MVRVDRLERVVLGLEPDAPVVTEETLYGGFVGGLVVAGLGLRALWRRWDLVDRLAGERDAYAIPEVLAYASREATMKRRRTFALLIRNRLPEPIPRRLASAADELEGLCVELEDDELALDPACAVSCMRLLSDTADSPLLDPARPPDELRSRVRQIRLGFSYRRAAT